MTTIDQFIWGYQAYFRRSVERSLEGALRAIGAGVGPRVYLVGFLTEGHDGWPVCFEPETHPLQAADLAGAVARGRAIYEAHPDFNSIHTHPEVHARFHDGLQNKARAAALSEALVESEAGNGLTFFAAPAVRVDKYEVHVVASVVTSRWQELPTLRTNRRDRWDLQPSLQEAVIFTLLRTAATALDRRTPPQSLSMEDRTESADLARSAANQFVTSIGMMAGQLFSSELRTSLDAVAAQPYEGRTGVGSIVLAEPAAEHLEVTIHFQQAIPISRTRAFRKALEMSGPDLHLLCDGEDVYGLGRIESTYPSDSETMFEITVVGRGEWEIAHRGIPLLHVENTRPTLPRSPLSWHQFADTVARLFPEASDKHIMDLWGLADAAAKQEHGTMLVVHRNAPQEALRLTPQALVIDPTRLTGPALRAMTNIDGAVLVAPDANCHAVGVILDGAATGTGDAARGARYNSAVRYLEAAGNHCLVIIVSEDGMINLLPQLRRRITRAEIRAVLAKHDEASHGDINFEEFYRRDERVNTIAFYLDVDQCAQVNAARDRVNAARPNDSWIEVNPPRLAPNPDMNETYLL